MQDVTFTELIAATFDRKRGLSEKMCRVARQSFGRGGSNGGGGCAVDLQLEPLGCIPKLRQEW